MVKQPARFASIVTHFDVVPSLLSFMKNRYGVKIPTVSAWIGHGLDTCRSFRGRYNYPLMRNKNEFMDFVDGTTFIAGNTFFTIYPNLDIEAVDDILGIQKIKQKLNNFKNQNELACSKNKLIPDSLIKRYGN